MKKIRIIQYIFGILLFPIFACVALVGAMFERKTWWDIYKKIVRGEW